LPGASASLVSESEAHVGTPAAGAIPARRPRVLQVITKLDLGGAESVAIDLVGALHGQVDFAVFGVMALAESSPVGRDMAERLARWKVPFASGTAGHFKKGGVLVAAWKLARAVRRFRADVVHLHTETPELTYAVATVLAPSLRRTAVLRTVHNCELWIEWHTLGRWVTERLANGTALAVSQAAADADAAIATGKRRPRPAVVVNGVVPPPQTAPRRDGPYRLLFAARFVPAKGSDLLPAILREAHARTARRDVEVTVAGTGPQEEALRAALANVAPGWTVEVVPPIEQLGQRLGEWDGVLMPSRFEGLGLLAIEALMAGVPVVVTKARGLDEAVPPDYPLCAAVDDTEAMGRLAARMIEAPEVARAQIAPLRAGLIARFAPAAMVRAYADAYAALASR
jgi:glycosyltransferase involved in cell wall biosynthesis